MRDRFEFGPGTRPETDGHLSFSRGDDDPHEGLEKDPLNQIRGPSPPRSPANEKTRFPTLRRVVVRKKEVGGRRGVGPNRSDSGLRTKVAETSFNRRRKFLQKLTPSSLPSLNVGRVPCLTVNERVFFPRTLPKIVQLYHAYLGPNFFLINSRVP